MDLTVLVRVKGYEDAPDFPVTVLNLAPLRKSRCRWDGCEVRPIREADR